MVRFPAGASDVSDSQLLVFNDTGGFLLGGEVIGM